RHAIDWLVRHGTQVTHACCIYATAPLLKPDDLLNGHALLKEDLATEFVFSATPFDFSIFRALKLGEGNEVSMFWPENELTRSQDLPPAFHDAGQFYWGTTNAWLTRDRIYSANSRAVILPPH